MEKKTIKVPGATRFHPEQEVELVQRWKIVHKKSRTTAGYDFLYPTKEACLEGCANVVKNNPDDIVERYFPEGVDAAPFWCYHNGAVHSAVERAPTFIQIRKEKKGNYVWSIYSPRDKFFVMTEGSAVLDEVKAEVLEVFPEAIFEILE